MFGLKKNTQITTILIDSSDVLTSDRQAVSSMWQPRHAQSNIGSIAAKAINTSSDGLDAALTEYIHTHSMTMPLYEPFHRIAFDHQSGASGNIWHHGAEYYITIKGTPELILNHCDISENERESITMQLHAMSANGAVVIAVAAGMVPHSISRLADLKTTEKLSFVGLISLQIDLSADARQLIAQAKAKDITVYICTGQHSTAAYYLTSQLGLTTTIGDVVDASSLAQISQDQLQTLVASARIFARCLPENKKRIIAAIKAHDPAMSIATTAKELQNLLAN
jgi:magnesium-transporting ATPase (P-type)